jgi:hypothetical protein
MLSKKHDDLEIRQNRTMKRKLKYADYLLPRGSTDDLLIPKGTRDNLLRPKGSTDDLLIPRGTRDNLLLPRCGGNVAADPDPLDPPDPHHKNTSQGEHGMTNIEPPTARTELMHAIELAHTELGPRVAAHLLFLQAQELRQEADRELGDEDVIRKKRGGGGGSTGG